MAWMNWYCTLLFSFCFSRQILLLKRDRAFCKSLWSQCNSKISHQGNNIILSLMNHRESLLYNLVNVWVIVCLNCEFAHWNVYYATVFDVRRRAFVCIALITTWQKQQQKNCHLKVVRTLYRFQSNTNGTNRWYENHQTQIKLHSGLIINPNIANHWWASVCACVRFLPFVFVTLLSISFHVNLNHTEKMYIGCSSIGVKYHPQRSVTKYQASSLKVSRIHSMTSIL